MTQRWRETVRQADNEPPLGHVRGGDSWSKLRLLRHRGVIIARLVKMATLALGCVTDRPPWGG